jgi:hypothetical protein
LLLSILAVIPAVFLPLAATSQIAPDRPPRAEQVQASNRYEFFAGYGYTSINQVNQSRYGLQGVDLSVTRDWGRYFGLIADGAFYEYPIKSTNNPNPGKPSVDAVLFGPVFHANLYGRFDGFVRLLMGGEHTGGESESPNVSFAGGYGVGVDYKMSPHFYFRALGDDILSSFSETQNSPSVQYSPHMHGNSRAAFGVVYKF